MKIFARETYIRCSQFIGTKKIILVTKIKKYRNIKWVYYGETRKIFKHNYCAAFNWVPILQCFMTFQSCTLYNLQKPWDESDHRLACSWRFSEWQWPQWHKRWIHRMGRFLHTEHSPSHRLLSWKVSFTYEE